MERNSNPGWGFPIVFGALVFASLYVFVLPLIKAPTKGGTQTPAPVQTVKPSPQAAAPAAPPIAQTAPTSNQPDVEPKEQSASLNAEQIFDKSIPAVVTIYAGKEIGSGSVIKSDGYILTNYHVVDRAAQRGKPVNVRFYKNQDTVSAQVVKTDQQRDMALLKIERSNLPTIPMKETDNLQVGQKVFAIGSPYGKEGTLTEGNIRRLGKMIEGSAEFFPGNSGGVLLDQSGYLVGMPSGIDTSYNPQRNYAIPIMELKSFINEAI